MANRILDLPSRISEILFGLIMALTFTGSLSAATAGKEEVKTMLFGAIGCNIAWGLVDAVMYVFAQLIERGRNLTAVHSVRKASDPSHAHRILSDSLPPFVVPLLPPDALEHVRAAVLGIKELPTRPSLRKEDFLGALGVFLLVVISTFPVVIPFMVMTQATTALRVSNLIAVTLLFLCGYRLGRYAGHGAWPMGVAMAVIGSLLVALTIALGG